MTEQATLEDDQLKDDADQGGDEGFDPSDPRAAFRAEMERRRKASEAGESSLIGGRTIDEDEDEVEDDSDDNTQDDQEGRQDTQSGKSKTAGDTDPGNADRQQSDQDDGDDPDAPLPSEKDADQGDPEGDQAAYDQMIQGLPQEARTLIQNLQQQAQKQYEQATSLHGRLAPMQREVEDLRKRLQAEKEANKNPPTPKDLEESPDWKEVAAEFPEEAGKLKGIFSGMNRANQEASQNLQEMQQALETERAERINAEMRRVRREHKDFDQIYRTPHFQQWREAIKNDPSQQRTVKMLNSSYFEDVVEAMNVYKKRFNLGTATTQAPPPAAQQQKARPQQATTHRREPPPPPPPSQSAGLSGQQRIERPLTDREAFSKIMRLKKKKQRKRQQR